MKASSVKTFFKSGTVVASLFVLAGCASVDIDQAVKDTNDATGAFTQGKLELSRTDQQAQARQKLSTELLAKPFTPELLTAKVREILDRPQLA